ncbi:MAG: hypothetical protein IPM53_05800 [Anaerolineaceae bacterium]|nr:hypothetical protein [Anaerolineaceae bacterium]
MSKKKTAVLLFILIPVVAGAILIQTEMVYLSHEAAVNDTVFNLVAKNEHALPNQEVDLARLNQNPDIFLNEISQWKAEQIELKNTVPFFQTILDDDPIYRLQTDLQVTFADGSQSTLAWESWRYGVIIGPIVISLGDGPPGFITAVAES